MTNIILLVACLVTPLNLTMSTYIYLTFLHLNYIVSVLIFSVFLTFLIVIFMLTIIPSFCHSNSTSSSMHTQGNYKKLFIAHTKYELSHIISSHLPIWNSLTEYRIISETRNQFKYRLDNNYLMSLLRERAFL